MEREGEAFRKVADDALGLAVSVFTLAYEDVNEHKGNPKLARQLVYNEDPVVVGQALAFVCKLLSHYMTPEQVRIERDNLVRRVLGA